MKFLDSTGLSVLWNKIKHSFLPIEGGGYLDLKGYQLIIVDSTSDIPNTLSIIKPSSIVFIYNGKALLTIDASATKEEDIIEFNNKPLIQSLSDEEINEVLV